MKINNTIEKVFPVVIFLFAVFSTTPTIALIVQERTISLFTIFTPIVIICLIFKFNYKNLFNCGVFKWMILFCAVAICSTLVGHFYFKGNSIYENVSMASLPKIIVWLILILGFAGGDISKKDIDSLAKGFFVGVMANLLWGCIDGIGFYLTGRSINNVLFSDYIRINDIRLGMLSIIIPTNNSIRVGGFNWDPAHIGMLAPLAFGVGLLKKSRLIQLISIGALLMSQSTLGIVGAAVVLLAIILIEPNKKNKFDIIKELIIMAVVGLLLLFIIGFGDVIVMFAERVFDKIGAESPETIRAIYNFKVLEAFKASPISGIFGTGFHTASYPYFKAGLIDIPFAFDPETTYVSYLFDVGVIGLLIYVYTLVRLAFNSMHGAFKTRKPVEIIVFCGIIAAISSNFFYHYIMYAVHMMIMIIGGLISKEYETENVVGDN